MTNVIVGWGPAAAIKSAAQTVLNERSASQTSCTRGGLSLTRLQYLMYGIIPWETNGGSTADAISPINFGRGDLWTMPKNTDTTANRGLYSDVRSGFTAQQRTPTSAYYGHKRAHWSSGVGFWHLDLWHKAYRLDTGDRIEPWTAGVVVGHELAIGWCKGDTDLKARYRQWNACVPSDRCFTTYQHIVANGISPRGLGEDTDDPDYLNFKEWDGGQYQTDCAWGKGTNVPSDEWFKCRFANTSITQQGFADRGSLKGVDSASGGDTKNPFPQPFTSFTHEGNGRYWQAWQRNATNWDTEEDREITRWAEPYVTYNRANYYGPRYSGSWADETRMTVKVNPPGSPPPVWLAGGPYTCKTAAPYTREKPC